MPDALGITPSEPEFDDMGKLLKSLGEGYGYQAFPLVDLESAEKLAQYDVVFLTCAGLPESWCRDIVGEGNRPGTVAVRPKIEIVTSVANNLREFVRRGGTLYASDLQFSFVAQAFKEMVDQPKLYRGRQQSVTAQVNDAGLREVIGPQLKLDFDQPGWRLRAAFKGERVIEYLVGDYETDGGTKRTSPLLVKFPYGDGHVIFTSFHNEKQRRNRNQAS